MLCDNRETRSSHADILVPRPSEGAATKRPLIGMTVKVGFGRQAAA